MRSYSSRFLVLLTLSLVVSLSGALQAQTVTSSSIEGRVEKMMNDTGIVGLGAAIIVNKKVVWIKGFGYADKDNKVPFTPNTVMNIGSISKTFTGVGMMRAVEDKKVSLDEDINKYLPFKVINPYFPGEKITLRNLATHTSGITDRSPIYEGVYHYGGDSPELLGAFLKSYFDPGGKYYSKENFLNVKPGTNREYSNIAAALAGYIVEVRTGQKLNEYTRKHIFRPLKMQDTGWFLSEINAANHSKLYSRKGDVTKTVELYGLTTYPDGGVRTSVSDLSKFFICLLDGGTYEGARVLKKESVEEMLQFQYTAANKPTNIELNEINSGLFWATKRNVLRVGHAGSDPGVRTEMLSDLAKEVAVIVFVNTDIKDNAGEDVFRPFFSISDELWKYAETLKTH
jgi:CubicO group peptidase (beta-lactamase class C family)